MSSKRLSLREYGAWITVDGQEVEHYQVKVDENRNLVTCWIASTEGKKFSIHSLKHVSTSDVSSRVYLDGQATGGSIFRAGRFHQVVKDGMSTGPHEVRPFVFGVLKVSDDDSLLDNPGPGQAIGEIRVEFLRVTNIEPTTRFTFSAPPKLQDIHERAKKATPHRVQYGEVVQRAQSFTYCNCQYHEKVAEFVIRYTSLEMLKATGIAPSEASRQEKFNSPEVISDSVPKTVKRKAVKAEDDSEDDFDYEEKENKKQEEILQAQLARIQKARKDKHKRKKVKRELKPIGVPGEIIDLTI
ncbi:hypothetical protein CPB83DRAFT_844928 [Crepidotus variabilis]|uniref:DUF7918 domain-containing protein n=1 Tax=Crepidotus variabilis TaxID=179855 RepID=A0A9P6ERC6_9AGAR|nr:hypothetical protein CPB83DRAFT_844928 [Crepidotus variabilis]